MKKMLFIYNPRSGKGQIAINLIDIIETFTKNGFEVTTHPTQSQLDCFNYIRNNAERFDVISCSGGDGTLNEAIKAYMNIKCNKPLGYIPAGTMNDFASTLQIPKDMVAAAKLIGTSEPIAVDVGSFNDNYFTYIAAFGAFTDVSYGTNQELKNTIGSLAYIIEAMNIQEIHQTYHLKATINEKTIEDDFLFGMVANSLSIGGIKGLAGDDVWLDDGIFECLLIKKPKTITETQLTINALIKKDFTAPYFYYFKSSEFKFSSDKKIPWTLDGEFGGNNDNVIIRNNKCCVNIYSGVK